jgi:5-methylcytosine-specific restriction protein A
LRQGIVTAFHAVDHIQNKAAGGADDLGNLQCICRPCHDAKTAAEAVRARAG